jgi:hypothetical protein
METNSVMLAGRRRSSTPSRSSDSRDNAASNGAAGNGEARRSPRATPRISSRSSVRDVRVIAFLHHVLDVIGFEFKRYPLLAAGLFDRGEEVEPRFRVGGNSRFRL